jgi:hypothetical protein
MELKGKIDRDLKSALLARDKTLATTLRGIKSAILNVEIAAGKREQGLQDSEIVEVLRKESKKRHESIELYKQGGNQEKADAEFAELRVIDKYLPAELSDEQLQGLIDQTIRELGELSPQTMGKAIAYIKDVSKGQVSGGRIAAAVKKRMEQK